MEDKPKGFVDYTGFVSGRLTVIAFDGFKVQPSGQRKSRWLARCECGTEVKILGYNLKGKSPTQSCGCYHKDRIIETKSTHGMTDSREYKSWCSMLERCLNSNSKSFEKYGLDDVKVCPTWVGNFEQFYEDMGPRPEGTTLNRINGAKLYSKDTCEWATLSIQAYDQRLKKTNTSGKTGVSENKDGKLVAYIDCDKRIHLGTFKTFEEALQARQEAEIKYFGWNKL